MIIQIRGGLHHLLPLLIHRINLTHHRVMMQSAEEMSI